MHLFYLRSSFSSDYAESFSYDFGVNTKTIELSLNLNFRYLSEYVENTNTGFNSTGEKEPIITDCNESNNTWLDHTTFGPICLSYSLEEDWNVYLYTVVLVSKYGKMSTCTLLF
jgi:hypothetical protein